MKTKLIIIGIFLLAAFFRLYGVNWDQGQHLHPDERFLTMVSTDISWPKNLSEYLDTQISPLNPHNRGFGFFVYGTFPIFFTKWVAENLGLGDYGNLTLVGRQLSAMVDLGTVLLVFLIATEISKSQVSSTKSQINIKFKKQNSKLFGAWNLDLGIFPLITMFLYSIMVLPIQLSHFYAVDTYLTFFITLCFYLLIVILNEVKDLDRKSHYPRFARFLATLGMTNHSILNSKFLILNSILGIAFGLALASKITAVLFLPIIGLGLFLKIFQNHPPSLKLTSYLMVDSMLVKSLIYGFVFILSTYLTFRLAQPYVFANGNFFDLSLNQKVLDNWKQLKSFDDATGGFPPAVQWITTKPYLFPLKNMVLWGLGLPLGIITIVAVIYCILLFCHSGLSRIYKKAGFWSRFAPQNDTSIMLFLSLFGIFILFTYQGGQFAKAMRYFSPIYPFLAIISGYFLYVILGSISNSRIDSGQARMTTLFVYLFICLLLIIYPLSFISIYSRPHSRVAASAWIYQNIPAGSSLSGEHWDDYLPMSLPTPGYIHEKYQSVEFPLYYPDNKEKWTEMEKKLKSVDYIILSSNRLYGSIMTVPGKYPVTDKYYKALFDGSLGFEKAAEFTSRPNIPVPGINLCLTPLFARYGIIAQKSQECQLSGISIVDDYADETFTVYDHPKVIIFKKIKPVDYLGVLGI